MPYEFILPLSNTCYRSSFYCIPYLTGTWNRFNRAYRGAIAALRGNGPSQKTFVEEHRSSFNKRKRCSDIIAKRPKFCSWAHKFVCLASCCQEKVPSPIMKEDLLSAGLGEKKITIPDIDCTTSQFHEVLMDSFTKLRSAGGFELLRCIPNTRDLEGIPSPVCHSPRLLRSQMGAARIYVRPIQVDLDMNSLDFEDNTKDVKISLGWVVF